MNIETSYEEVDLELKHTPLGKCYSDSLITDCWPYNFATCIDIKIRKTIILFWCHLEKMIYC